MCDIYEGEKCERCLDGYFLDRDTKQCKQVRRERLQQFEVLGAQIRSCNRMRFRTVLLCNALSYGTFRHLAGAGHVQRVNMLMAYPALVSATCAVL